MTPEIIKTLGLEEVRRTCSAKKTLYEGEPDPELAGWGIGVWLKCDRTDLGHDLHHDEDYGIFWRRCDEHRRHNNMNYP